MSDQDPYSQFKAFRNFLLISTLTLSFGCARYFQDRIDHLGIKFGEFSVQLAYLLAPLLAWVLLTYVIGPMLVENTLFRRWVLGKRYIEGMWVEYSVRPNGLSGVAIIEIQPNGENFEVKGQDYNRSGGRTHRFYKLFHEFRWPHLKYCYENTPYDQAPQRKGVCEWDFTSRKGRADQFEGSLVHGGDQTPIPLYARRLTSKEVAVLATETGRRAVIEAYFQECEGDLRNELTNPREANVNHARAEIPVG